MSLVTQTVQAEGMEVFSLNDENIGVSVSLIYYFSSNMVSCLWSRTPENLISQRFEEKVAKHESVSYLRLMSRNSPGLKYVKSADPMFVMYANGAYTDNSGLPTEPISVPHDAFVKLTQALTDLMKVWGEVEIQVIKHDLKDVSGSLRETGSIRIHDLEDPSPSVYEATSKLPLVEPTSDLDSVFDPYGQPRPVFLAQVSSPPVSDLILQASYYKAANLPLDLPSLLDKFPYITGEHKEGSISLSEFSDVWPEFEHLYLHPDVAGLMLSHVITLLMNVTLSNEALILDATPYQRQEDIMDYIKTFVSDKERMAQWLMFPQFMPQVLEGFYQDGYVGVIYWHGLDMGFSSFPMRDYVREYARFLSLMNRQVANHVDEFYYAISMDLVVPLMDLSIYLESEGDGFSDE